MKKKKSKKFVPVYFICEITMSDLVKVILPMKLCGEFE